MTLVVSRRIFTAVLVLFSAGLLKDVKRVRELTGCGVMEARRALEAAGWDVEADFVARSELGEALALHGQMVAEAARPSWSASSAAARCDVVVGAGT
jgi:translation elongation factor EF-Ts